MNKWDVRAETMLKISSVIAAHTEKIIYLHKSFAGWGYMSFCVLTQQGT